MTQPGSAAGLRFVLRHMHTERLDRLAVLWVNTHLLPLWVKEEPDLLIAPTQLV